MNQLRNAKTPEEALDIEAAPEAGASDVQRAKDMADKAIAIEAEIAALEEQIKGKRAALSAIVEGSLVELMKSANLNDFTLDDKTKVKLNRIIRASVPKNDETGQADQTRYQAGLDYIISLGQDGMIKRTFTIFFGRADVAWAKKFQRDMAQRKKPLDYEMAEWVEPGTLSKFVRDTILAGGEIDKTKLSILDKTVVEIKPPRAKKADSIE